MLKKDSIEFGVLIGIVLPAIMYGILHLVNLFLASVFSEEMMIRHETQILISIFTNLLPVRIYFVNLKFDKTGRGILLVMFLMMILYFSLVRSV